MKNTAYLYILDTMADWEIGYLLAELHSGRNFKENIDSFEIITISNDLNPIKTMGGIVIKPQLTVNNLDLENISLLILPGGETWLEDTHIPILKLY